MLYFTENYNELYLKTLEKRAAYLCAGNPGKKKSQKSEEEEYQSDYSEDEYPEDTDYDEEDIGEINLDDGD